MRALVCDHFGPLDTLRLGTLPDPTPGPGQVLIEAAAGGLNFPDLLMVQGLYQVRPPTPFAPGQEGAGVVTAVGEGVDRVAPGDRVAHLSGVGAFAESVVADADAVVPIPDAMDMETAAGFSMAYGTSYYALKDRAALQPGETLLVLGAAGGVGLAAVELGAAMGARVIAAASTDEKLAVCRAHGAAEVINYTEDDLRDRVKEITGGRGVDVLYDPVGGPLAEPGVRSMAWGGRYLVVGFAAGEIPSVPLNLPLLKSCALVGVFWGAWVQRHPEAHRANTAELFALYEEGAIRPHVSSVYPLDRFGEAFAEIAERRARGKVVITLA